MGEIESFAASMQAVSEVVRSRRNIVGMTGLHRAFLVTFTPIGFISTAVAFEKPGVRVRVACISYLVTG